MDYDTQNEFTTKPLTTWSKEPTVTDLKGDYTQAKSDRDSQVAKIDGWLDLLHVEGNAKPKKVCGKSAVQPKLVRKQAEWRYSALSEPFLNNDDIFAISPKTHADREAARQNELILNYQFNNQIDKVNLIDKYVRAAVNEGTVIARVSWEYEEAKVIEYEPTYKYEEVLDQFTQQTILNAQQLYLTDEAKFKTLPEPLQESVYASMENQRPIKASVVGSEEVELVRTVKNQPAITICDPRYITVDPTCDGDLDKANFIIYTFETSMSELNKAGIYENLDMIQCTEDTTDTMAEDDSFRFQDKPRKKLVAYEYWGYWDIDDSGMTTPIVATWVGDVMIRMERNPFPDGKLPFVIVPYLPVTNSVYGEPDATLLEDNQKLIGALTRGMIDSMARSANGQIGMRKDALDAVNLRKYRNGQDYMFNPNVDPRSAIIEHTYPELPASSYNMLQMFQLEAESITGVKSFTGGLSGDSLGTTARAVTGVLDAAGKRELGILRRLAGGMQKIAKKILAMNAVWLSDEELVRITDEEFVSINRENLNGAFDIKLSISTAESDNIKAQELSFMLQTMGQSLPFDMTKIILSEIARLRNMPDLSKLLNTFQPQPDPMQQLQQEEQMLKNEKLKAEIQKVTAEAQMVPVKAQAEMAKARKASTEANLNDLDFVEQETGVKQERALELQQAQAEGNTKRDIMKSVLDNQLNTNTQ